MILQKEASTKSRRKVPSCSPFEEEYSTSWSDRRAFDIVRQISSHWSMNSSPVKEHGMSVAWEANVSSREMMVARGWYWQSSRSHWPAQWEICAISAWGTIARWSSLGVPVLVEEQGLWLDIGQPWSKIYISEAGRRALWQPTDKTRGFDLTRVHLGQRFYVSEASQGALWLPIDRGFSNLVEKRGQSLRLAWQDRPWSRK